MCLLTHLQWPIICYYCWCSGQWWCIGKALTCVSAAPFLLLFICMFWHVFVYASRVLTLGKRTTRCMRICRLRQPIKQQVHPNGNLVMILKHIYPNGFRKIVSIMQPNMTTLTMRPQMKFVWLWNTRRHWILRTIVKKPQNWARLEKMQDAL